MGGVNTRQEVHILKEARLRYAPDYVVVNFVLNACDFFLHGEGSGEVCGRQPIEDRLTGDQNRTPGRGKFSV